MNLVAKFSNHIKTLEIGDKIKMFKKMTPHEKENSRRGMIVGFLFYMFVLGINSISEIVYKQNLVSSYFIFISGLSIALGYEVILNLKNASQTKKNDVDVEN